MSTLSNLEHFTTFYLGVFYNELETRIRLSKRVKGRDQKTQHSNTILAVKHRQMDDNEVSAQSMRKQVPYHA